MALPSISTLRRADYSTRIGVIDLLFEPSPQSSFLADTIRDSLNQLGASADRTRPDELVYGQIVEHVADRMVGLITPDTQGSFDQSETIARLHVILGSHPRLGARKVDSAQSRAEQAQLNDDETDEAKKLAALNAEYEAVFPGLRYVVFVNGRGRDVIMEDMRRRIARGDIRAEEREAIQAMRDIALDRVKRLGVATFRKLSTTDRIQRSLEE